MYLGVGNIKLGVRILTFSLPPVLTCPGRTAWCTRHCYGRKGYMRTERVLKGWMRNYEASLREDFVPRMVEAIRARLRKYPEVRAVRVHAVGDFYSQEYLEKWKAIARELPELRFVAWTKSWMLDFRDIPENFTLFYSVVPGTEQFTEQIPRLAYVQEKDLELPKDKEVVFCPYRRGRHGICSECLRCYGDNPPEVVVFARH